MILRQFDTASWANGWRSPGRQLLRLKSQQGTVGFDARVYLSASAIASVMTVNQSLLDLLKPSAPGEEKKWYEVEPAEGHRFLSEVLQLRNRREILKFIDLGIKTKEEIVKNFGLNESVAEVHLVLLEKAMVIEKVGDGYRSTPVGIAYLKNFEDFASDTSKDQV
jgi:predicted transcriptional regulator